MSRGPLKRARYRKLYTKLKASPHRGCSSLLLNDITEGAFNPFQTTEYITWFGTGTGTGAVPWYMVHGTWYTGTHKFQVVWPQKPVCSSNGVKNLLKISPTPPVSTNVFFFALRSITSIIVSALEFVAISIRSDKYRAVYFFFFFFFILRRMGKTKALAHLLTVYADRLSA